MIKVIINIVPNDIPNSYLINLLSLIQLFLLPSFCWFPVLHRWPSLLFHHNYGLSFSILSRLSRCSINVRVSFPLKPSFTCGSASPWRGIPQRGLRTQAGSCQMRSDQTELQEKRPIVQCCVFLTALPVQLDSEITAVLQLFLSFSMTHTIFGFSLSL